MGKEGVMKNIVILGLISFFADVSTEMVYPLIPLYLTAAFGATPALVGLIEGIAESTASLLKVFSGYFTDKYQKKKAVAFTGYATGLFYKIALILATSWFGILFARVVDRLGKGIRTAPRDVMVSESADPSAMGKAFGIHKALDMAGAALGILMAYFLLKNMGSNTDSYLWIFGLSAIPVVIALGLFFFVKEKKSRETFRGEKFWENMGLLDNRLKLYLVVVFLFTLGNSSNTFLLLRAKSIGYDDASVILLYFLYSVCASALAIPFGKISDRIGRKKVLVGAYIIFAAVYFGFAFVEKKQTLILIFAVYGLFTAMSTGAERAFVAEIAPPQLKGTMLGLQSTLVGIALLPASIIFGLLWNGFGVRVPFIFGGSLALISAIILWLGFGKYEKTLSVH